MTNLKFNILLAKFKDDSVNHEELCQKLKKERDLISNSINELIRDGYLNGDEKLTEKGLLELKSHKVDNAIILAAGMCSRFVPLNYEKPKGLLEVNGEVLIERQIRQLREVGIQEIIVVVGYMKEAFEYLVDKYNVILVESKDYAIRNNYSSVYAAKDYLKNTIITSSDLYFNTNLFQPYAFDSYYTCIYQSGKTAERGIETDDDDKIINTFYGDKCYDVWVTLGHAYFSKRFSEKYIEIVSKIYDLPETKNKFWADIQDDNLKDLYMYSKRCNEEDINEFDSFEELKSFDKSYVYDSRSSILKLIAKQLNVKESNLQEVETLSSVKKTMFAFKCNDESYVVDVNPTEEKIINVRGKEFVVIAKINSIAIYESKHIAKNVGKYDSEKEIAELYNLTHDFVDYHKRTVPLCAAENVISHFANLPLVMGFQERYIMNNTYSFSMEDNFIGCEKLYPFYQKLSEVCERVFGAKYSDARPFTGMNCIDMVLKSITHPDDKLMILSSQHGGHASVRPVAEKLGIKVFEAPYDLQNFDVDYEALNKQVKEEGIKFILLAPSDIIKPMDITKIDTRNCVLLYDCSQLLGLIAAGLMGNPLKTMSNIIMFGGTHKTFPGPASGLILTNDKYLHDMMEKTINPLLLRHSQMHQKISLLFALIEFEKHGKAYMQHMVHCSRYLASKLKAMNFDIAVAGDEYSYTHQVFIRCSKETMDTIYNNAYKYEITLNKKHKDLFNGYGIRLGTQELARYNWNDNDLDYIAEMIKLLADSTDHSNEIENLKNKLSNKEINFAFSAEEIEKFKKYLLI